MTSRREFLKHSGLIVAASSFGWPAFAQGEVVAETTYGRVRGVEVNGIKVFKGIPYGASTTGKNRFMPPAAPAKWSGVRDALAYGSSAPQSEPGARRATSAIAVAAAGLPAESEGCLGLELC